MYGKLAGSQPQRLYAVENKGQDIIHAVEFPNFAVANHITLMAWPWFDIEP